MIESMLIYSNRKAYHPDATFVSGIAKSYGVLLPDGRLEWLVRKGDVIRSNRPTQLYSSEFWIPASKLSDGNFEALIFSYSHRDDDDVPHHWANGQHGKFFQA